MAPPACCSWPASAPTVLSGSNTYTGGTNVVLNATLQVTNNSSVGSGTVTPDNALFQADGVRAT